MKSAKRKINAAISDLLDEHLPTLCPAPAKEKISNALSTMLIEHLPTFCAALLEDQGYNIAAMSAAKQVSIVKQIIAMRGNTYLLEQTKFERDELGDICSKNWVIRMPARAASDEHMEMVFPSIADAMMKFEQLHSNDHASLLN